MGWFEGYAHHFDKRGNVDRKKEARAVFSDESCILKDALVGTTYYAAIKTRDGTVCIYVALTSTREGRYFAYKPMDASMGPCQYNCPESILKLNTNHSDFTDEWIQKCRDNTARKKEWARIQKGATILRITFPWETKFHKEGESVIVTKGYRRGKAKNPSIRWQDDYCYYTAGLMKQLFEAGAIEIIK